MLWNNLPKPLDWQFLIEASDMQWWPPLIRPGSYHGMKVSLDS